MADRRILIIAGPNGAGKTTFATEFLPNEAHCPNFVNADLIAAGLSPFRPGLAAFRAGRLMLRQIHEHAGRGDSFAFETTLSGLVYSRWIRRWRTDGGRVKLFYLRRRPPRPRLHGLRSGWRKAGTTCRNRSSAGASMPGGATSSSSTRGSSMNGRSTTIRGRLRNCWRRGASSDQTASGSDTKTTRPRYGRRGSGDAPGRTGCTAAGGSGGEGRRRARPTCRDFRRYSRNPTSSSRQPLNRARTVPSAP